MTTDTDRNIGRVLVREPDECRGEIVSRAGSSYVVRWDDGAETIVPAAEYARADAEHRASRTVTTRQRVDSDRPVYGTKGQRGEVVERRAGGVTIRWADGSFQWANTAELTECEDGYRYCPDDRQQKSQGSIAPTDMRALVDARYRRLQALRAADPAEAARLDASVREMINAMQARDRARRAAELQAKADAEQTPFARRMTR